MSDRENASCACFDAAYGPAGANATVPATETTVTTCEPACRPCLERAGAPDRAEVVRPQHLLDPIGVEVHEVAATRDARVQDEEVDPAAVPLEHRRGHRLDLSAVADVAELVLAAERLGERLEPLLAARDEHAVPPGLRERPRGRLADAARRTGDDCDSARRH